MLFKFKSQAASDLIMLEADARRLLCIMLGNAPVKGIVLAQDLPRVIATLQTALAQDQAQAQAQQRHAELEDEADKAQEPKAVSLSQRAAPMLKLLQRSLAHQADVRWGV